MLQLSPSKKKEKDQTALKWLKCREDNKIKAACSPFLQNHHRNVWPLNFKASSEPSPKLEPLKLPCISGEFCTVQVHSVTCTAFITPIYPDPSSRQMLLILTLPSQMFHSFPLKKLSSVSTADLCTWHWVILPWKSTAAFTFFYRGRLTSLCLLSLLLV